MSLTFKRKLVWVEVCDAAANYDYGTNGRKSRAKDKPLDRRIQRRQHAKIIRDELRLDANDQMMLEKEQHELEHDLWMQEMAEEAQWEDGYSDDYCYKYLDEPDYLDGDSYLYDDHPDLDYSYSSGSLSRQGITRLDQNVRITQEDVGMSLGDMLANLNQRRPNNDTDTFKE